MHPLLAPWRRLLAYLSAWGVLGLLIAGLIVLADLAAPGWALVFAIPLCGVYAFAALSAYYLCRALPPARRSVSLATLGFGGAAVLVGLGWLGLAMIWNGLGILFGRETGLVAMTATAWALQFAAGTLFYLLSIGAHEVLIAFESLQAAGQREVQARLLARDFELQALRAQIDPHFLFNSLNSISALTHIDADAAREMTIALAQFFRRTLALSDRARIVLAEELALVENFLAIEQRRFGAKLASALRIDAEAQGALIPPLLLQPLVENAIKHGIRHLDESGVVDIEARVRDGWLHLRVCNPLAPEAPSAPGLGLGLKNLRERLAALYGGRARVAWRRAEGHFEVEINLPCEHEVAK
jgi:PIN domain nuclease of toxin-antitoxin system